MSEIKLIKEKDENGNVVKVTVQEADHEEKKPSQSSNPE